MAAARAAIGKALPRGRALVVNSRVFSSRKGSSDDFDVEAFLSDVPPRQSKNAASSEAGKGGPSMWESLMKQPPKTSTSSKWDFLKDLDAAHVQRSRSPSSFRNLAESGIDFLAEDFQRFPPSRKEPASASEQPELGEQALLHAASFKLIKDTLSKAPSDTDKKALGDTLGFDSSAFFSSTGPFPKEADSRTLAEVEQGSFFTTKDESSLNFKAYTYEELGQKLRSVRPPEEQILSSATGLSFGELRTRIQKIEQDEREGPKHEFLEIKESLNHLKVFRKDPTSQLSCKLHKFFNQLR
ncbi:hypothetical protein GOP47_0004722 [Adiantum capillus-veneris]|uniref:Uncharacterized protein n=1 Tax=Adiantum capillus-veneris TaxID=13818 RepID=A0A9D4V404_ADICA|nr:hypothetical protein GOP47_0004722 [Adiantum capillus-veneris]